MTDRDIYDMPHGNGSPHLNGASVFVRDQQAWTPYTAFLG